MRSSVVVFLAASLASAGILLKRQTPVPACAQTCYTSTDPAPCTMEDVACRCLNPNYIMTMTNCVQTNCSPEDAQITVTNAATDCKAAGIDWANPQNSLPACAATCDLNTGSTVCPAPADPSTGALPDIACFCKDTAYVQAMNTCFNTGCTGQDLIIAQNVGSALCRAHGVDLSSTVPAA